METAILNGWIVVDRNHFHVSVSRYSGVKSKRISEVAAPTLLEKSVDEMRITATRDT